MMPRPGRRSKLDPLRKYLKQWIQAAHPERSPSSVLEREIAERGYQGKGSILRADMASLRPPPAPDPIARFETYPGDQMQVDWGKFRAGHDPLSAFVATLGRISARCAQSWVPGAAVRGVSRPATKVSSRRLNSSG